MQRVLITAGATGIGYALAKKFSDAGYHIWIIDISKEALKNVPKIGSAAILMCVTKTQCPLFLKKSMKNGLD